MSAPKGRGAAWTEERGTRNERRATKEGGAVKGNGEVGGAPEAQSKQSRAPSGGPLPLGGEASRAQGADDVLGAKAARLGRACAAGLPVLPGWVVPVAEAIPALDAGAAAVRAGRPAAARRAVLGRALADGLGRGVGGAGVR